MDLVKSSLKQIAKAVQQKHIRAVEVAQFFSDRIQAFDKELNSYITLNDQIIDDANAIDQKIEKNISVGPLAGVPMGIKDMFCTRGLKTTAASKMLENFIPPYDATVVEKLRSAGMTVLGKLNQDEFAMGSSNETSFFGPCKNPWDLTRVPGGSSGGSAAAQAAKLCAASLGTDTGGSIRQPASFCGVVGVKPTYGRVSRYGIVAFASSLDQAGPLTSTVEDAALILEIISGHDQMDATSSQKPVTAFSDNLTSDMRKVKVGVLKECMLDGLSPATQRTISLAIENLKKQGAEIVEVSVPLTHQSVPMYYLIAASEASSNLARYDGIKYGFRTSGEKSSQLSLDEFYSHTRGEGFGEEVKRRIMLGTYCLSSGYIDAYYKKACQVRRLLQEQFVQAFQKCDVILSPVCTHPAFKLFERNKDPLSMYMNDVFTVSTNLAGLPGMSVPYGASEEGLPIGVQLNAPHFAEQVMLNVGLALEKSASLEVPFPKGFGL